MDDSINAPARAVSTVSGALQWIAEQSTQVDRINFGTGKRYVPSNQALKLRQLFLWRYKLGLTWRDIYERAKKKEIKGTDRLLRLKTYQMSELVEWLTTGERSEVYVPPHGYGKTQAAKMLRERLVDADARLAIKGDLVQVQTALAKEENREAMVVEDAPIFVLAGPTELRIDRKIRKRLGKRVGYKLPSAPQERTLAQDLFICALPRVTRSIQTAYRVGSGTLRRLRDGRSTMGREETPLVLLENRALAGWSSLVLLRNHGLQSLPVNWFRYLFSPKKGASLEAEYGRLTSRTLPEQTADNRRHARRLWKVLGSSSGVAAALPSHLRSKETTRGLFRATRQMLEDVEFDADGKWKSGGNKLVEFIDSLTSGKAFEGDYKTCRHCKIPKDLNAFSYRSKAKKSRHSWCRECRSLMAGAKRGNPGDIAEVMQIRSRTNKKPMSDEVKKSLKLVKAARAVSRETGVRLVKPMKKRARRQVPLSHENDPSPLEEFVTVVNAPEAEAEERRIRADRRVDRMMRRAVGGDPEQDVQDFVTQLRLMR